jgi:hypothetical protein
MVRVGGPSAGLGPCATGFRGCEVASGRNAAVDVPDGAGDPDGGGGEQERDDVGQVAGADPAQPVGTQVPTGTRPGG